MSRPYTIDLIDKQWALVGPPLPPPRLRVLFADSHGADLHGNAQAAAQSSGSTFINSSDRSAVDEINAKALFEALLNTAAPTLSSDLSRAVEDLQGVPAGEGTFVSLYKKAKRALLT